MDDMHGAKVLLVEDEPDTITLYKNQLHKDGFAVVVAKSADDGVAAADKERPALILLDIMMPGKSGFEVLESLKKSETTKHIPIVALTNLAEEVGFDRAMEKGAAGYIVKAERTPAQVALIVKQILNETKEKDTK